jgi:hypothetical protein
MAWKKNSGLDSFAVSAELPRDARDVWAVF